MAEISMRMGWFSFPETRDAYGYVFLCLCDRGSEPRQHNSPRIAGTWCQLALASMTLKLGQSLDSAHASINVKQRPFSILSKLAASVMTPACISHSEFYLWKRVTTFVLTRANLVIPWPFLLLEACVAEEEHRQDRHSGQCPQRPGQWLPPIST